MYCFIQAKTNRAIEIQELQWGKLATDGIFTLSMCGIQNPAAFLL